MPNKIQVDLRDKHRALLTEVLPYELPLWFHNYNFYNLAKNKKFESYKNISGIKPQNNTFIPLSYRISRGESASPRELSIMHPFSQLKVCDFYHDFDEIIEYFCSKSSHSLRYPYRRARQFYDKSEFDSKRNIKIDVDGHESITASSYFKYKKYAFLYAFFESYEYHQLEKRFQHMLQVDIAKCFPSIYTHSISWAVKAKKFAKENLHDKSSFDAKFDDLMQTSNYRETNGIIIGPEVSRIFSEVILQRIDLDVVKIMDERQYLLGKDYQFKRYVDDYFIFYNNPAVKKEFFKSLEESLLFYKLYLNEAKTKDFSRPFTTSITLAKNRLKEEVDKVYSERYCYSSTGENRTAIVIKCSYSSSKANKAIRDLKNSFSNYAVSYQSISNYLISSLEKKINVHLKKLESLPADEDFLGYANWLLVDIDVLFFVHAMDIRIRPTDLIARIAVDILSKISAFPADFKILIHQKIFDQVRQAIDIFCHNSKNINGIETLNLLLILTKLPSEHALPEAILKKYFIILTKDGSDTFSDGLYFLWVTFMLYIVDNDDYKNFRACLTQKAEQFLTSHADNFKSTGFFLFFFDFLSCPYIDRPIKNRVLKYAKEHINDSFSEDKCKSEVYNQDFIVSWRDPDFLNNSLAKKKFIFPYE